MHRIASLVLLAGCNLIPMLQSRAGARAGTTTTTTADGGHEIVESGRTYRVGPYWGPDCERVGARKSSVNVYRDDGATMGKQPNLGDPLQDQVLRLVCVDRILSSESEPGANTWVMQYVRFDELAFDHWTAAMMLVECLEARSCLDAGAPQREQRHVDDPALERRMAAGTAAHRIAQSYEVAMMRWYAERVDPAKVATRLAALPLAPAAQQTYLALVAKAKARVLAASGELSPDLKRMFVDLPADVHTRREAGFARHAPLMAQLATLSERVRTERGTGTSGVTDATLDQLRQLRIAYATTCKACTHDPIFVGISRELFWSYVSRGDGAAAMAEAKLLEHPDPTAAVEIAKLQRDATGHAIGRNSRVERARGQGIDADSARSAGSASDLGDGRYLYNADPKLAIDWISLVPDGGDIGEFDGKVAALERRGATVLVRFADRVSTYSESTGCYETNRIDSIDDNGKLNYRQACTGSSTHVEHEKVAPVLVPAAEAAGVSGGDELVGFAHGGADPRLGRVWLVKRGSRVVRLREVPL